MEASRNGGRCGHWCTGQTQCVLDALEGRPLGGRSFNLRQQPRWSWHLGRGFAAGGCLGNIYKEKFEGLEGVSELVVIGIWSFANF